MGENEANEAKVTEQLRSIKKDARAKITEKSGWDYDTNIGILVHRAADEIDRLQKLVDVKKSELQMVTKYEQIRDTLWDLSQDKDQLASDVGKLLLKHYEIDNPQETEERTVCLSVDRSELYYIKNEYDFKQILEREKPEYSYDLMEEHREDVGEFNVSGFYNISYEVVNPCSHGFWIDEISDHEIDFLIQKFRDLLKLLSIASIYRRKNDE